MRAALLIAASAAALSGCGNSDKDHLAREAYARANSAYAMADEQRVRADELEERIRALEAR